MPSIIPLSLISALRYEVRYDIYTLKPHSDLKRCPTFRGLPLQSLGDNSKKVLDQRQRFCTVLFSAGAVNYGIVEDQLT
jgi:hypothetical protein